MQLPSCASFNKDNSDDCSAVSPRSLTDAPLKYSTQPDAHHHVLNLLPMEAVHVSIPTRFQVRAPGNRDLLQHRQIIRRGNCRHRPRRLRLMALFQMMSGEEGQHLSPCKADQCIRSFSCLGRSPSESMQDMGCDWKRRHNATPARHPPATCQKSRFRLRRCQSARRSDRTRPAIPACHQVDAKVHHANDNSDNDNHCVAVLLNMNIGYTAGSFVSGTNVVVTLC